ncbi:MAG: hypothetical protein HYS87_02885 [Candidatus Colwellbacteria bacterium]|nr:hypothetical protein [Candidatus Colwellbacteria bacterium]
MPVEFRIVKHSIRPVNLVEVILDSKVIATICPDDDTGIRVISAHITKTIEDDGSTSFPPIPHVTVLFNPHKP